MEYTTDVLISGAGPSGLALAVFLRSLGVSCTVITKYGGTANSHRAHMQNAATNECFRDVGLEASIMEKSLSSEYLRNVRFTRSFLGQEYGRAYAIGNGPANVGRYENASPSKHCNIEQGTLEPLLVQEATTRGAKVRFDTEWLSATQDAAGVESTVLDRLTGNEYTLKSKYLIACDGAKSAIAKSLDLKFENGPGGGLAINVHVKMNLSRYMEGKEALLSWVLQPGAEWLSIFRMIRPWNEWVVILMPTPACKNSHLSNEEYLDIVKQLLGEVQDPLSVELCGVWKWEVQESVAETYQKGRIICAGDSVHRHPPFAGLGRNTSIQDSYGLAWRLAYVLQGKAGADLLPSYTAERQPVGAEIVRVANDAFRNHLAIWKCLGVMEANGNDTVNKLMSEEGATARTEFREAMHKTVYELQTLGTEMNQLYQSGAIVSSDEPAQFQPSVDSITNYDVSTYPGKRLPHVWLTTPIPSALISTHDLAGKGKFTLFTGVSSRKKQWLDAASQTSQSLGITIECYALGLGGSYNDCYSDWTSISQIEEDGCILVRPDRFIAWRTKSAIENPSQKLKEVLQSILHVQ